MKKNFCLLLISLFSNYLIAQDSLGFRNNIHLGIGFPHIFKNNVSNRDGKASIPLLYAYNFKTSKLLALGVLFQNGNISTVDSLNKDGSKYGLDKQYFTVGFRPDYHFGKGKKFDPYIGISILYFGVVTKERGNVPPNSNLKFDIREGVNFGGQLGFNYYFIPKIGAFAEVAYGLSYINTGLTFRF